MNKYTIYCTPSQTRRALELGAPIEINSLPPINGENFIWLSPPKDVVAWNNSTNCFIPTAEQMLGWLETQGIPVSSMIIPGEAWKDNVMKIIEEALTSLENKGRWQEQLRKIIEDYPEERFVFWCKTKEEQESLKTLLSEVGYDCVIPLPGNWDGMFTKEVPIGYMINNLRRDVSFNESLEHWEKYTQNILEVKNNGSLGYVLEG